MYTGTSTAFNTLVMQDSRTFVAQIVAGNRTISDGIASIRFTGGSNSSDDFSVGSTISQYVEIKMFGDPSLEGQEFLLKIGMNVNGTDEYVPMGYFTAQKPDTDDDTTTFTAYDRMMNTERLCSTDSLPDTTTTIAMLNAVASSCGVPVTTSGLTSKSIAKMEGLTCREVLEYISQMYGGFAIVDRSGNIAIKTYADSSYSVVTDRYFKTFKHNDLEVVIEKVTCITGKDEDGNDITISDGTGRETAFSNPYMTEGLLTAVYNVLRDFTYMPGTVEFLGDPRIDAWDILTVYDLAGAPYKVPCMSLRHSFDGGLTTSVDAVGKSEAEVELNYKGPATKYQARTATELALIGTALVTKLDAETAAITYATITNLDAANVRITTLNGDYATFKTTTTQKLTATDASITTLNTGYANIKSLLAGNAATGDLTSITLNSRNASIDSAFIKSLVTQNVTVYDLAAGSISTDQITIGTDDMVISGNLIQMYDANDHLRIQMGQDAQGNFTFLLYDATGSGVLMDATGIKASAIADGLIVNSMVANNAAIAGSKLDINSVVTAINGGTTNITSSKIWFNDQNKSLDQVYSSMSSSISTANTNASSAVSTASQANTTANQASATASQANTTANQAASTASQAATNASSAVSTANQAATNASTAVSTANQAASDASDAMSAASQAASDASDAISTANQAASDASSAVSTASQASTTASQASTAASQATTTANQASATAAQANTTANQASATASQANTTANQANTTANQANATASQANTNASNAVSAVNAVETRMTTIESSMDGLVVDIQDMQSEISGLSDGTLIFQTPYVMDGDDVTFTARLYKAGQLVTTEYDDVQFTWLRRTETGDEYLGYGYTKTVDKSDMGLGGVIIARFTTRTTGLLQDRNGNYITDRSSNRIDTYIEEI